MHLRVHLFAAHREAAGTSWVELDVPPGARVLDLRAALAAAFPSVISDGLPVVVAVNGEFARDDRLLRSSDEVALFPPVSGG